ncbi:hypothetical protein [Azospirillum griseum]|uniref:Uncharacterized protein n=1 Tax=Azospirillum griseum TaxID=2496639 RepID=A0A431VIC2_9PROT|nr:hypothetical protein [Azospirillum griseum]RTR20162.1 hypothetical protein EJ903_11485 [Azospirillum griseum]
MSTPTADTPDALRALLDAYLRCPLDSARAALEQGLRAYQDGWIRARAGADAPPPVAAAPAATPATAAKPARPKFPIAAADLATLGKIADGWAATTADVSRWAWFEDRELVTLDPNPAGSGPEVLRLTATGWAAVGRVPPTA